MSSYTPHDSCSDIEHCNYSESELNDAYARSQKLVQTNDKPFEATKKSNSFDRKLLRDRQVEPRYFVYVYDYSKNKTRIMKKRDLLQRRESEKIEQAPIPSKGSLAICTGNDGFGGGQTVVARVHISPALRLQQWFGIQKQLYIVDDINDNATRT